MALYYETNDLTHYGVVGMKWGVRRATRKRSRNEELRKKALKYDKKAASMTKKSEKLHATYDLEKRNRKATKAAAYDKKAAQVAKKALKTDGISRSVLERRSERLKYKATVARVEGNRMAKTTGYGAKAMRYSIKSDKLAVKAAKARKKIANNNTYIDLMKRRVSEVSKEDRQNGYAFVNELLTSKE